MKKKTNKSNRFTILLKKHTITQEDNIILHITHDSP